MRVLQVLCGWLVLPGPVRGMGAWYKRTIEPQKCNVEPGNDNGHFHITPRVGSGHPITAQAATVDRLPFVASYSSLGRRLHYSVPEKHGGQVLFRK